jgi:lysophospholipase L1-like esterase
MNKEQGTRNKVILHSILGIAILLFAYSVILTLHYQIPQKVIAKIQGKQVIDSSWNKMYEGMVLLSANAIKKPDSIMLGDSITYGAQWNDLFSEVIFNRGIGGDRTTGVINRLDSVLKYQPKKIFLMIGINDISAGTDNETIYKNIVEIVNRIQNQSITPFVYSILHVTKNYKHAKLTVKEINDAVDRVNDKVSKYCRENQITYIDLNALLLNDEGYLKDEYSYDNIHLNNLGYEVWIKSLKQYQK